MGTETKRVKLYQSFIKIVDTLKPMIFLAENVRGILSIENGKIIKKIVFDFEKVGYKVEYRLFHGADFGIPQNRERVLIVGVRKGFGNFIFPEPDIKNALLSVKR